MALSRINSQSIADGTVIASDIADGSITTAKIADGNVTSAKIDTVANTKIAGVITTSQLANNLTVNASSIISSANIDFKVGASQNTAFRIEDTGQLYNSIESTEGTDYRGSLYAGYMCRAWVNFNGTNTVAIRASGNVSSITDNGTGDYTVNMTTAMPDGNYSAVTSGGTGGNNIRVSSCAPVSTTSTSQIRVIGVSVNFDSLIDLEVVSIAVFR